MSNRWPGGLIRKNPTTPAGPGRNGAASGVWTLAEAAYWKKQGVWPGTGPQFITSSGVTNSTTLNIPAHQNGDLLLVVNGAQSATPPATTSGYTSLGTISTTTTSSRSARVQYIVSDGTITSVAIAYYGAVAVIRNHTGIGKTTFPASATTTKNIAVSLANTGPTSIVFFGSYAGTTITSVTSLTLASNFGGYEHIINSGTTASGTLNYSVNIAGGIYYGVEIL